MAWKILGGGNNNSDDIDDPIVNPGGSENPGSSDNPGGSENPGNSGPSTTPSDDEIELDWADDEKYPFIPQTKIAGNCSSAVGKYKLYIQSPKSGKPVLDIIRISDDEKAEPAIHINVTGAGKMSCSLPEGTHVAKDAIYTLYLSAFTAQETKFTITDDNGKYLCYVYFKDGTGKKSYGTFDDVEEPREEVPPVDDDGNINWDGIDFITDGAGGGIYNNKYKVYGPDLEEIVNIQDPGWEGQTGPGIYVKAAVTIKTCSLGEDRSEYYIQGGGIILYLTTFESKVTEFTITDVNGKEIDCAVYYVDGAE